MEFNNPYIDTVALSRFLSPDLKKHKLDVLAEYYNLGEFNHHRADDDAEMLAEIYIKMTEAMRERILEINPEAQIELHTVFFDESRLSEFDFSSYDYVVDAIDSLGAKIELIAAAKSANTPIISAMGAGNKLDPTRFEISDISKTEVCPLARAVRTRLRKRGITNLKVVYSKELPHVSSDGERVPASISFVPSAMGLVIASAVVRDLAEI
jgi:tRNA A37 threonylcarbamoyladenosine dehydratase